MESWGYLHMWPFELCIAEHLFMSLQPEWISWLEFQSYSFCVHLLLTFNYAFMLTLTGPVIDHKFSCVAQIKGKGT